MTQDEQRNQKRLQKNSKRVKWTYLEQGELFSLFDMIILISVDSTIFSFPAIEWPSSKYNISFDARSKYLKVRAIHPIAYTAPTMLWHENLWNSDRSGSWTFLYTWINYHFC